mmetsp:Transcript_8881/g.22387  ORF Transcript_8881/g.22387 Transcript_8881/m.22387 type:complete len:245 (+) Transcript_8881:19-753(+)
MMMKFTNFSTSRVAFLILTLVVGLIFNGNSLSGRVYGLTSPVGRREAVSSACVTGGSVLVATIVGASSDPRPAGAIDNESLNNDKKPAEFVAVGQQAPPPDGSEPFATLSNGVKVKDVKIGQGDAVIKPNSKVDVQLNGRLLNLNGVMFYSTKKNNPDGFGAIPLSLELGKGTVVPGLETGLVGMKKNGIRRIIVPQDLAYSKFPGLEPSPTSGVDQRALDSVVKNSRRDATILFDVQVERIKQ